MQESPGTLPSPPHQTQQAALPIPPGQAKDACVTVLEKLGAASKEGPVPAKNVRRGGGGGKPSTTLGVLLRARPSLPPRLLTKYFLNILRRPPWPRAGCPCLSLPMLGQRTKTRERRGGDGVTPHPFALAE